MVQHGQFYKCNWYFIIGLVWILSTSECNAQCRNRSFIGSDINCSFFPVLCWDSQRGWGKLTVERKHGLESIKECNFTIAGFLQHTKDIRRCDKLNIQTLVFGDTDTTTFSYWNRMWADLTDEEIDQKIRKMVERTSRYKSVTGYFLCDEPGASVFPQLAKAVECVKKYAPDKLAYINLFPDYATLGAPNLSQLETYSYEEYLDRFLAEVKPQFISYDNYMVEASVDMSGDSVSKSRSYYENLLMIRQKAIENGLPFWNIVASNQINPSYSIPSPTNMLFQAYTTLAAGGRGVSWFTYYLPPKWFDYAPINRAEEKTQTWYYLEEVNRQISVLGPTMNRLLSTGVYFTSPAPFVELPELPGKLVKEVRAEVPVMVGEFKSYDRKDYVMVVNLSLQKSVRFEILLQEAGRQIKLCNTAGGELVTLNTNAYWLVAGQGALLKLE
jgi:hypothetical protein